MMQMKTLIVTLEAGFGTKTVPLILMESSFHADVRNWSSKLNVTGSLTMEVAYFNEALSIWEPLLEPVEKENGQFEPFELQLQVIIIGPYCCA